MSEKSVSRIAEERRERDHESNRQKTSKVKSFKPKPSDSFTRVDQHASFKGLNLGSNRNAEGTRQVTNRERVGNIQVEAHGASPEFAPDQFERSHEDVDSESKAGGHKQ